MRRGANSCLAVTGTRSGVRSQVSVTFVLRGHASVPKDNIYTTLLAHGVHSNQISQQVSAEYAQLFSRVVCSEFNALCISFGELVAYDVNV